MPNPTSLSCPGPQDPQRLSASAKKWARATAQTEDSSPLRSGDGCGMTRTRATCRRSAHARSNLRQSEASEPPAPVAPREFEQIRTMNLEYVSKLPSFIADELAVRMRKPRGSTNGRTRTPSSRRSPRRAPFYGWPDGGCRSWGGADRAPNESAKL